MDDDIKSSARNLLYFYWNQLITRERENSFKKWRTKGNTWLCFEYATKELQLSSSEDVFCDKPRNVTVINSCLLEQWFWKARLWHKRLQFLQFLIFKRASMVNLPHGEGTQSVAIKCTFGGLNPWVLCGQCDTSE